MTERPKTTADEFLQRQNEVEWRRLLVAACTPDPAGETYKKLGKDGLMKDTGQVLLIRGVVRRIECVCGTQRLDDGMPCKQCGLYPRAMFNREDDGRI